MRKLTAYGPSIIVAATAAAVLLAGPTAVHHLTHAQTHARIIRASERLQHDNVLEQINNAYRDIAMFVEPSVVHIAAQRRVEEPGPRIGSSSTSTGSGWIYDDEGHIVTNHHVIDNAHSIEVQLYNGEIRRAEVVGYDRSTDIAVLKIRPGRLHPAVRRNPEITLHQGDMVFAFGSPFDFRFSMSAGVVSGQGRSVGIIRDHLGSRGYENFIQVDAAINPGNSGGPLTDFRGHVIGMNTAIATGRRSAYDEGQFAGIGLAIPMEMIEPVVQQLITTGEVRKGFLGVSIVDRTMPVGHAVEVQGYNGRGVMVARLDPDLAIEAGTLLPGDVVTRLEGRQVGNVEHLLEMAHEINNDGSDTLQLTLWRFDGGRDSGVRRSVVVPARLLREMRGISLLDLQETITRKLELQGFTSRGVPVVRLDPTGPAGAAGLRAGDVLTHVNDRPVGQVDQVRSLISSMLPDDSVELRIWRYDPEMDAGGPLSVAVTLAQLDPLRTAGVLPPGQSREAIPELGIARMSTATRRLTEQQGIEYHPGVLLEELVPESTLASRAQPGAIIVRVMDRAVTDVDEFIEALRFVDLLHRGARLGIINPDGSYMTVVVRVE